MKLYEISHQLEELMSNLQIDENGEINPEQIELLGQLKLEETEKVISIGRLIKNLDAECAGLTCEVARLKTRVLPLEKKIAWLENYLTINVAGKTFKDSTVEIKWRKSQSVNIIDEKIIPNEYKKHIPEAFIADKNSIKEALKEGKIVCGVELKDNLNLQIK